MNKLPSLSISDASDRDKLNNSFIEIEAILDTIYQDVKRSLGHLLNAAADKISDIDTNVELDGKSKLGFLAAARAEAEILQAQLSTLENENFAIRDALQSLQLRADFSQIDANTFIWRFNMLRFRVIHLEYRFHAKLPVLAYQHQLVHSISSNKVKNRFS
jgi:uncharacterized Zn finger protein